MKFRKKPVVIEAFQWTRGTDQKEDPEWVIDKLRDGTVFFINEGTPEVVLCIQTLEGPLTVSQGDFIIKGIKGEIYPCKPDIFEMTYDKVTE